MVAKSPLSTTYIFHLVEFQFVLQLLNEYCSKPLALCLIVPLVYLTIMRIIFTSSVHLEITICYYFSLQALM